MPKRQHEMAWQRPVMPVDYLRILLDIAQERGVDRAALLAAGGLDSAQADDMNARISPTTYAMLVIFLIKETGDEGIGLYFGLRLGPTAHGAMGYALMCCATLREASELALRFQHVRMRGIELTRTIDDETSIITLQSNWGNMGRLGHIFFEGMMAIMYRIVQVLLGDSHPPMEFWFDYAEPAYFKRFSTRLPPIRFNMPSICVRYPVSQLDRPLIMPNAMALKLAILLCEQEQMLAGGAEAGLIARVQAELTLKPDGYPSLTVIADHLNISARTLKRKLAEDGTGFKVLLENVRRRDALRLLENPTLPIHQIATLMGYTNPANFTRAFNSWVQQTPTQYRLSKQVK